MTKSESPKIAWIDTVPEQDATGELRRAYQRSGDAQTGHVDHIMKIHSLNPASLVSITSISTRR